METSGLKSRQTRAFFMRSDNRTEERTKRYERAEAGLKNTTISVRVGCRILLPPFFIWLLLSLFPLFPLGFSTQGSSAEERKIAVYITRL